MHVVKFLCHKSSCISADKVTYKCYDMQCYTVIILLVGDPSITMVKVFSETIEGFFCVRFRYLFFIQIETAT